MTERALIDATDTLAVLRSQIGNTPAAELPAIIGALEGLKAEAFARLVTPAPVTEQHDETETAEDRLLTAEQVAERLGQSVRWVRDHQGELPRVTLPGRALRFSERRLASLIKRRSYGA